MQRVFLMSILWIGTILLILICTNVRIYSPKQKQNITVSLIYDNKTRIYELEPYSTVGDLLDLDDGEYIFDESKINRNRILGHRDVITLPELTLEKCVSINTSNLEELQTLKGVGAKAAQAIIDFREDFGLFTNLDDIMKVKGIGQSKFDAMKDSLCL